MRTLTLTIIALALTACDNEGKTSPTSGVTAGTPTQSGAPAGAEAGAVQSDMAGGGEADMGAPAPEKRAAAG